MLALYGCESYRHLRREAVGKKRAALPHEEDTRQIAECSDLFATAERVVLAVSVPPRVTYARPAAAGAKRPQDNMEYVLAPTAAAAVALVCNTPPPDRCYFFLIEPERPVYAYLDFDARAAAFPQFASYAAFRAAAMHGVGAFAHFVDALYGVSLRKLDRYDGAWHLYEACTADKWSIHAHAAVLFDSVATLRAVVQRFVAALRDLARTHAATRERFFAPRGDDCIIDCAVYTSRPFRLPWCCKTRGASNYLRPLAPAASMAADVLRAFVHPSATVSVAPLGAPAPPPAALCALAVAPPQTWEAVCAIAERCLAAAAAPARPAPPAVPLQLLLDADCSVDAVLAWLAGSSAARAAWVCAMYALCRFCLGSTGAEPAPADFVQLAHTAYVFCTAPGADRVQNMLECAGVGSAVDAPTDCGTLYLPQLYGALCVCAAPPPLPAGARDADALAWLGAFVALEHADFGGVGAAELACVARHLAAVPVGLGQLDCLALLPPAAAVPPPAAPAFLALAPN